MTVPLLIRSPREEDLKPLTDLYNHYIQTSPCTFDLNPYTTAERETWFKQFSSHGVHRLVIAEIQGAVVGYACSAKFREKAAYATSIEVSVYCRHDLRAQGIGPSLYQRLFHDLKDAPVHRAYAVITLPNEASVSLHAKFGFKEAGVFREVGYKFGRYWDVAWLEKAL